MHKTDAAGNVSGLFVDLDPITPTAGTIVDAAWLNDVQQEIVNVILTKAGITLVKGTQTQLGTALDNMYAQTCVPGGRLTLTTAVPVTTADVTAATSVFYSPYRHDRVQLYDGTRWNWFIFTEMSQATTDATKSPAAVAASKVYDLFVWNDSGTLRCTRGPAWSSDTVRGTGAGTSELQFLNGRYVNKNAITNGAAATKGLYVGTIRSDASSQINDSLAKRHVWNNYNRVMRAMSVLESTSLWVYSSLTTRQSNGSTANQLDFVIGLSEDAVYATSRSQVENSTSTVRQVTSGIGLDSTTTYSGFSGLIGTSTVTTQTTAFGGSYEGLPGIGRHFLAWLEQGFSSDTQTWLGASANGIQGELMA